MASPSPSSRAVSWIDPANGMPSIIACCGPISNSSGYGTLSGTSMAAPHVTGTAALLAAANPGASPSEIKQAILAGVDPLTDLEGITVSGGRLNLANSLGIDLISGIRGTGTPENISSTLLVFFLLTVLTLAPAILVMTTSFTRIIVVFGFLRQAMATQQSPPNQVLVGLALGEQQRVAFCRALANEPALLLADEPTGNLDPGTSDRVFGALMDLVRGTGLSALIATHNLDLAARMDRMVKLDQGRLINA